MFGFAPLILMNFIKRWPVSQTALTIGLIGVIALVLVALLGGLAQREVGRTLGFGLALWAVVTGVVIIESSSITIGAQAVALAAAIFGAWIVTWWVPSPVAAAGVSGIAGTLLLAIVVQGYYLAQLTTFNAVLLTAAPLAMWIGDVPFIARRPKWVRATVRLLALAAVLAIPATLATLQFLRDTAESAEGYY
jgi:hypothetical protein